MGADHRFGGIGLEVLQQGGGGRVVFAPLEQHCVLADLRVQVRRHHPARARRVLAVLVDLRQRDKAQVGVPGGGELVGLADVFTLQSGEKLQLDCGYRDGSDLQLGVRPEHLKLELLKSGSGSENNSEHSWTVDVVERLGVESFIHLCNAARDVLVLRLEGDCDLQVDSKVAVRFDCSHCYLFNDAGVRLLPNSAALHLVG